MEALRNLREAVYDLIDLRSVRDVPMGEDPRDALDEIYEVVGPPRQLAGQNHAEAQQPPEQGGNQR